MDVSTDLGVEQAHERAEIAFSRSGRIICPERKFVQPTHRTAGSLRSELMRSSGQKRTLVCSQVPEAKARLRIGGSPTWPFACSSRL